MSPSQELLDELVQRIMASCHPKRIILFGSAARGNMGPDSDLDVLVVVEENIPNARAVARQLYFDLRDFSFPVDFVVTKESTLEEWSDFPSLVYYPALREGRSLYAAA